MEAIVANAIKANAEKAKAQADAELKKQNKTRKKPCPKGTRYNNKTGECDKIKLKIKIKEPSVREPPAVPMPSVVAPSVAAPMPSVVPMPSVAPMPVPAQKKVRLPPCPKGTRRNKKGECKSVNVPSVAAPMPSVAAPMPSVAPSTAPMPLAPAAQKKARLPPCPKGTRRNKKGECVPNAPIQNAPIQNAPIQNAPIPNAPIVEEEPNAPLNIQNQNKNKLELLERADLTQNTESYDFLYPNLNDPDFNLKISERKEFNDNKYDGEIQLDIAAQAELLCNSDFELAPHQIFVRNFLSFQTPYNSLLLYHGLGSGKTCSAISIAEEMRDYMMQMGINSQIMIVASPNVQSNFRVQLFDERKLKKVDGIWNIRDCIGNKFLKEINPMNMKGLSQENVAKQIHRLIDTYYSFSGYVEFANYINKTSQIDDETLPEAKKNNIIRAKLRQVFNNRLIIIDEVHNIRVTEDNKDKRVADELLKLIKSVSTLRLLLLSATPMFNSYKEIIWLLNLMNMNDRRATIEARDVFTKEGNFKVSATGEEIGRQLLERKATGYISFVRGENPYTFPYRLFPKEFAPEKTFPATPYPTLQLNGTSALTQPIEHLSLYLVEIGEYQQRGYNYIVERIKGGHIGNYKQMPNLENIETFGYTMMQQPLEGLNMIYPDERLFMPQPSFNSLELVGGEGLKRLLTFVEDPSTYFRSKFAYKPSTLERYGRLFAPGEIGKYSSKIKSICESILQSTGIVLIYSQYIDAGLVPMALALEELGFTRAGEVASLFDKPPVPKRTGGGTNYVMITGDKGFSPNPAQDIKRLTNEDNITGAKVKVVLISQTGAEGLDLKYIRQIHILEPWYNMNRIEQIIGRGVRTCSHKALPFAQRNVELYLYGSLMRAGGPEETADLYIYRLAEVKAVQIGKVSRVLKEISIDCILNYGQTNFTEENMAAEGVKPVMLELASGGQLEYKVGDKPYSAICDYMESCAYTCRPNKEIPEDAVRLDTYNENFIMMNNDKLIYKIKQLMKERFFYQKKDLVVLLKVLNPYPLVQINAALHQLIENKTEYITDKYGRLGHLINIKDLYLFQPLELNETHISLYERSVPLEVKRDKILVKLPKELKVNEAIIKINENPAEAAAAAKAEAANSELYKKIMSDYSLATTKQIVIKGEKSWYMFCHLGLEFLMKNGVEEKILHQLIAEHMVDELYLADIQTLLKDYQQNPLYETEEVFKYIKAYISRQILTAKNLQGFLWREKSKQVLLVRDKGQQAAPGQGQQGPALEWRLAEAEDLKDFQPKLDENKTNILANLNPLIGFMYNFKAEDYVVFKTKDVNNSRDAGARCDQNSNKGKAIDILNSIVGTYREPPSKNISQKEMCIIQELYLRLFDKERKNKKRWFLSPPEAVLTNIEKYSTVEKKGKKKI
jgi:hypothetical protein